MSILETATTWGLDNVTAWWKERRDPTSKPISRFRKLVEAHGLTVPQVLRLVPRNWEWSLENLSISNLRNSLTEDKLGWFAERFGVRRVWLEGASEQIYDPIFFYKNLKDLPHQLERHFLLRSELEILAFTSARQPLDSGSNSAQEITIVFSVPLAQLSENDRPIRRYVICGDRWDWCYPPCRWDLKLFARKAWLEGHVSIPIVPVSQGLISRLASGLTFPALHDPFHIGNLLCLEDYGLTEKESVVARERSELSQILSRQDTSVSLFQRVAIIAKVE